MIICTKRPNGTFWAWSFGPFWAFIYPDRIGLYERKIVEFLLPALFDTDKSADGTKRYYLG